MVPTVFTVEVIFRIVIILQENIEWAEWQASVLSKRNTVENVFQWACGYVLFLTKAVGFVMSHLPLICGASSKAVVNHI